MPSPSVAAVLLVRLRVAILTEPPIPLGRTPTAKHHVPVFVLVEVGHLADQVLHACAVRGTDLHQEVDVPAEFELIVKVKDAEPDAPVVSVAVTVTEYVPAVVGVPEIRPLLLIDRPVGRPVAL